MFFLPIRLFFPSPLGLCVDSSRYIRQVPSVAGTVSGRGSAPDGGGGGGDHLVTEIEALVREKMVRPLAPLGLDSAWMNGAIPLEWCPSFFFLVFFGRPSHLRMFSRMPVHGFSLFLL